MLQTHILSLAGVAYFVIHSTLPGSYKLSEERESEGRERVNVFQSHPTTHSLSHKCFPYRKRMRRYCHSSLLEPKNVESTQEGKFSHQHPDLETFDLVHAHVVVRHGDRTPALAKPRIGHPDVKFRCGVGGVVHRSEYWGAHRSSLWEGLNEFPPLSPMGPGVRNRVLQLHPGPVNQTCGVGDLTARGYLQLHNLGTLLPMSYGQLFPNMDMTTDIHVQSTDYRRTIRSAGAFLLGFIPNAPQFRQMITIHVQPGNLNEAPPIGIPLTYKPCNALLKLREAEKRRRGYYTQEKDFRWMYDKVADTFNLTLHPRTQWSDIFDKFTTRGCHALDSHSILPCTRDGVCVECRLAKGMFDFADWSMAHKYPPNSSLVGITPFLRHSLLEPIERIIAGDQPSLRYRVMLTFTHDSTLNQLLKTLGLPLDEWVPYASRLSFELWKVTDYTEQQRFLLRVLFNGKIVTHQLPFSDKDEDGGDSELVDFAKFKRNVVPMDLSAYNKLCGV